MTLVFIGGVVGQSVRGPTWVMEVVKYVLHLGVAPRNMGGSPQEYLGF